MAMDSVVEQVQGFLGVPIPTDVLDSNFEVTETLKNEKVREVLAERDPQLYVDRAVFLNSAGKNVVLATF